MPLPGIVLSLIIAALCLMTSVLEAQVAPVTDSPLVVQPQNAGERLEAVILLTNLGRHDLARGYLEQILTEDLSDEELLALRDAYGTTELFRLSRMEELQPLSQQLLDRVSEASKRNATNPARIDRILEDLSKSPREREYAILELRNIGIHAVPRLLQHLGDPQTDQDRGRMVQVLVRMGPQILPALLGALETPDSMTKTALLEAIGQMGDSTAVDDLWYPAFSPEAAPTVQVAARGALSRILHGSASKARNVTGDQVATKLTQVARDHFFRKREMVTDDDGRATVWSWDADQATVIPYSTTVESAGNHATLRYARQVLSLAGENLDNQALYLAAVLSDAGYRTGWEDPLPTGPGTAFNLAVASSVPVLSKVVDLSLAAGRVRSAEAAMTALSLVGDRNLLRHTATRPSPLIRGLNATDRRVQFAAAVGILQLEPQAGFPSSQRVVEILLQAVNDNGSQSVLVIDPNNERGREIVTAVSQMGFVPEIKATGKQGFLTAAERGDVALVLIHLNSIDWELSQTLANFRADSRTSGIPIAIYGPTYAQDETRLTVQRTPLSTYIVYSDQRADIERQLKPFLESILSKPLTDLQRQRRSEAAMSWLSQIGRQHGSIFNLESATDVLFNAINDPALAADAISVLGAIPTRQAQIYLGESVLNPTNTSEQKEQAALTLAQHIRRHGVLMEKELVLLLKQRRDTETDLAVQTALATVVGTLQPSPALVKERLQQHPLPAQPAQN